MPRPRARALACALGTLALVSRGDAYPYLSYRHACGDAAHPTHSEDGHPGVSALGALGIDIALYWSAYDGSNETQAWETWANATTRLMPESWRAGEAYAPGGRLTVVVDGSGLDSSGVGYMVLLTTDGGVFEDVTMHEDHVEGNGGSVSALLCDGRRLNPTLMTNKHKFIWRAPADGPVKMRVTMASGEDSWFHQHEVTFRADPTLQPPSARNITHAAPTHDNSTVVGDSSIRRPTLESQNLAFAAHGAMMFAGFWMLMPAAVGWSRFGRPGPGDKQSATWLTWHKWLMTSGALIVAIAALVAFAAISEMGAEHYDCAHGQLGLLLVIAATLQPLGGFLRPANAPAGEEKTRARTLWETAHRALGYGILALAFIAVLTGIDELSDRDDDVDGFFHSTLFVAYVAVGASAFAFLERARRSRETLPRAAFVELSTMASDDPEDEFDDVPLRPADSSAA